MPSEVLAGATSPWFLSLSWPCPESRGGGEGNVEGVELPLPKASKEGPLGILQAWRKKEGSERKAEPQTRESSLVFLSRHKSLKVMIIY